MLTTILEIISTCAWPAVIITALIMFRPRKKR